MPSVTCACYPWMSNVTILVKCLLAAELLNQNVYLQMLSSEGCRIYSEYCTLCTTVKFVVFQYKSIWDQKGIVVPLISNVTMSLVSYTFGCHAYIL